jgi:hypothetical protein
VGGKERKERKGGGGRGRGKGQYFEVTIVVTDSAKIMNGF